MFSYDETHADSLYRQDKYIKEEDVDVRAVVEATLRERGFGSADHDNMDTS